MNHTRVFRYMLACLLIWTGMARAVITDVSASPSVVNLSTTLAARLQIVWEVTSAPGAAADTVQSSRLLVTGPGGAPVLQTEARVITLTVQPGETRRLTEVVQLSAEQVRQLTRLRDSRGQPWPWLELQRTFIDQAGRVLPEARVRLYLTGSTSGELSISRLDLRFDNGSTIARVDAHSNLRAMLEVTHQGSGSLEGIWELADPASTSGTPVYRVIRRERVSLSGYQTRLIASPPLPTQQHGLHVLRFRLLAPRTDVPTLRLIYYVGSQASGRAVEEMQVLGPAPDAPLSPETRFAWQPVPRAHAYQIDFFSRPDAPDETRHRIAGLLIPADRHDSQLSAPVLARLASTSQVHWRVQAYDDSGQVIGRSSPRPIRIMNIRQP